jgi:hypothetical protein
MSDAVKALASITPKMRVQVHQSFIRMLSVCQLQAFFRYELGIRRPPAAYLHVGTAVDKSVTGDLQNKITHGELLKRSEAVGIAEDTFDLKMNQEPIELEPADKLAGKSKEQVVSEAKEKTLDLAGLHYDRVAPTLKPSHVARRFSIDMDTWLKKRAKQLHQAGDEEQDLDAAKILHAEGRAMNSAARIGIDLAGEIDVQETYQRAVDPTMSVVHIPDTVRMADGFYEKAVVVRDTKTSGKSPSEDSAEDSNQLVTYSLATLVLDNQLPSEVSLDYLVRTPKRHDLKYVPRSAKVDMSDINVMLFRFARAVHSWNVAKKTGAFLPANSDDWHCSANWCGYFQTCPAARRPKSVQVPSLITEIKSAPTNY